MISINQFGDGKWYVWIGERNIGCGLTRDNALEDAEKTLRTALEIIQKKRLEKRHATPEAK